MSEAETKKSEGLSRRDFLRLMGAAGTGLAFAPFIPFGDYMPNPNQASLEKVPVILPDGSQAKIRGDSSALCPISKFSLLSPG